MSTPRRKNLKPDDRRAQLLDCAQQLFIAKGYQATTISDVMAMAGVSKGGFYHHFDSKEALLEALATRISEQSMQGVQAILDDPCLDPFARLNTMFRHMRSDKLKIDPDLSRAFEMVFLPGNLQLYDRVRRASFAVVTPALVRILEEGVADGVFSVPDVEAAVAIMLHINTATYDAIAAALAERDTGQMGPALAHLYRMISMQGIAIDRLLGLPDGSISWIEPGTLEKIMHWEKQDAAQA